MRMQRLSFTETAIAALAVIATLISIRGRTGTFSAMQPLTFPVSAWMWGNVELLK